MTNEELLAAAAAIQAQQSAAPAAGSATQPQTLSSWANAACEAAHIGRDSRQLISKYILTAADVAALGAPITGTSDNNRPWAYYRHNYRSYWAPRDDANNIVAPAAGDVVEMTLGDGKAQFSIYKA